MSSSEDAFEGLAEGGAITTADFFSNPGFRKRPSAAEAEAEQDSDLDDELDERALFVDTVAMVTYADRLRIYARYNEIRLAKGLPDEFSEEKVLTICKKLLKDKVLMSKKVVINVDGVQEVTYLQIKTLRRYRWEIWATVSRYELPRALDMETRRAIETDLTDYCQALVDKFKLRDLPVSKAMFGAEEVAIMMCWVLRSVYDADSTIQFCTILLTLLYTGCRASSLFPTSGSGYFLTWSHLELIPRRIKGVTVGFDVRPTLDRFKGFTEGVINARAVKEVSVYIRTVSKLNNLLRDYGAFVVAHALRSGVFGESTLEDLYADKRRVIPWPDEFQDSPIFLASKSRGIGLSAGAPLTANAAGDRFRRIARECGMATFGMIVGMSSVRRGVATYFVKKFGAMTARLILGHTAFSRTLEERYDQGKDVVDIASAILGDEEGLDLEKRRPIALRRNADTNHRSAITLSDAFGIDHLLRQFLVASDALQQCIVEGSEAWRKMEPLSRFSSMSDMPSCTSTQMLKKVKMAIKRRARSVIRHWQLKTDEEDGLAQDQATYETIMENAGHLENELVDLPVDLVERMAERAVFEIDTSTIEDDEDNVNADIDLGEISLPTEDEPTVSTFELPNGQVVTKSIAAGMGTDESFKQVSLAKKNFTLSLISLQGQTVVQARTDQCELCLGDKDITSEQRTKVYKPWALTRHQQQFHQVRLAVARWLATFARTGRSHPCPCCTEVQSTLNWLRYHVVAKHQDQIGRTIPAWVMRQLVKECLESKTRQFNIAGGKVDMRPHHAIPTWERHSLGLPSSRHARGRTTEAKRERVGLRSVMRDRLAEEGTRGRELGNELADMLYG